MRIFIHLMYVTAFVFATLSASASSPWARNQPTVRIASWNVAHFYAAPNAYQNGRLEKYQRSSGDLATLQEYARHLKADILLLQELDSVAAARLLLPDGYCFEVSPRDSGTPVTNRQKLVVAIREDLAQAHGGCGQQIRWITPLGLKGQHLRFGAEFKVMIGNTPLWLLGVHLKSSCHEARLDLHQLLGADASRSERRQARHCQRYAQQIDILNDWIETKTRDGVAFMILGDFNRRFDKEGATPNRGDVWPIISDGAPPGQTLVRATRFRTSPCWKEQKYNYFIDHFIMNERAASLVQLGSFDQPTFDVPYAGTPEMAHRLSDHCAIRIGFKAIE